MSQPAQNKISNLQDFVKQSPFLGTLFVVSFLNWFLWFGINLYLHGDALGTIPSRDGFTVKSHGHFTPVSESVWVFSLFYSGATMLLTPAIWIGAAARMIGGRLQQPKWFIRLGMVAFILVWCLGWYASIGRSFRRSVEDWQTLKRPNAVEWTPVERLFLQFYPHGPAPLTAIVGWNKRVVSHQHPN
jgi:hypothetical protein